MLLSPSIAVFPSLPVPVFKQRVEKPGETVALSMDDSRMLTKMLPILGYYQTARSKRRVSHVRRTVVGLLYRTRAVGFISVNTIVTALEVVVDANPSLQHPGITASLTADRSR